VLLGLLLRPETAPQALPAAPATESFAGDIDMPLEASTAAPDFSEKVAEAQKNVPPRQAPPEVIPTNTSPVTQNVRSSREPRASAALPTIHQVRANGTVVLPDLHLDIHVFSDIPEDRFVFINMSKQREDSQLAEGPMVEEITPEGVVLEYGGTSFLLPRE